MCAFGVVGYLLKKFDYEGAPLLLGMVLGLRLETALRRSLLMEKGDLTVFFRRPISAVLLFTAIALLVIPLIGSLKRKFAGVRKGDGGGTKNG
jgi:putative tricarboxylic transport membrane protein